MNYRTFDLEDWISHINEAIKDERGLDGNEMRDLVAFLREIPRWTPVSKGLPKKNTEVLAITEWGAVTIAERCSENDWFIYEGDTTANTDEIKAWCEIPPSYQGKNKSYQGKNKE